MSGEPTLAELVRVGAHFGLPSPALVEKDFYVFHCWFLSMSQVLVLLDGVDSPEALKQALWKTRHVVTGGSDVYFDHSYMKNLAVRDIRRAG